MSAGVSVGDREVALENEILRVEVGSGVHGMAIGGFDDLDLMAVYVEPAAMVIGLAESAHHYVERTAEQGARSGPDDVDLTCYALRKFARLASVGNPTILTALFVPETAIHRAEDLGRSLLASRGMFLSQQAGWRYLGYLDNQLRRMQGGRGGMPYRPELVEKYGYDTKYASHAIRLGLQGVQLVTTGELTLPLPEAEREWVMEVKRGSVRQGEALARIDAVRGELAETLERGGGVLPEEPDRDEINTWLVGAHVAHWMDHRWGQ